MSSERIKAVNHTLTDFNVNVLKQNKYTIAEKPNAVGGRNVFENYRNQMEHICIQTNTINIVKSYDPETKSVKFLLKRETDHELIDALLCRRNHFLQFVVDNQKKLLNTDVLTIDYLNDSEVFRGILYQLPDDEDKYLLTLKVNPRTGDEPFGYIQCQDTETGELIPFEPSLLEKGRNVVLIVEFSGGYVGGKKVYERANIIGVRLYEKTENTRVHVLRREYSEWKPSENNEEEAPIVIESNFVTTHVSVEESNEVAVEETPTNYQSDSSSSSDDEEEEEVPASTVASTSTATPRKRRINPVVSRKK